MSDVLKGACHCGQLSWTYKKQPDSATACNCTVCRRYGALWIYGLETETITTSGKSSVYLRGPHIEFHFCPTCGGLAFYQGSQREENGSLRMAANLRMVEDPKLVQTIPVRRFDGFDSFKPAESGGCSVADYWL